MPRARILVVDDDEATRLLYQNVLQTDFDVTVARNGAEALSLLSEASFELILSDLNMPDINGIELLKRAKELHPLTPFIVISAEGGDDKARSLLKMGAKDYLCKPIIIQTLLEKTRRALKPGSRSPRTKAKA